MPDPSHLPPEIFLQILYDVIDGKPDQWIHWYNSIPSDLCLVNKQWHRTVTPLLYSRFEFTGDGENAKSLWGFFRTIITRPDLAAHIRHLTFTNQHKPVRLPKTAGLYRRNAKIIHQALTRAGLENVGDPEQHLREADHRPLVALILAHATGLTTLQLHIQRLDPYLDAILAQAVAQNGGQSSKPQARAFQSLRTLYLASAETAPLTRRRYSSRPQVTYPARMNASRPFHRLPKLKELLLIDAQLDDNLASIQPEENALAALTITFRSPVENIQPVLQYATKLTQLSLSLSISGRHIDIAMHEKLWEAILRLRSQLEYLDLYEPEMRIDPQGIETHATPREQIFPRFRHLSFCCPLHQFTKLRQLCITPLLLLGHECPHDPPTKFVSHLPPNLESFALYGGDREWILRYIERLEEEMVAIPKHKPPFPLNSILVDAPWPPVWAGRLPYKSMVRICEMNRIMFNTAGRDFLFYGGSNTHFGETTHASSLSRNVLAKWLARHKARDIMPRGMRVQGYSGTLDVDWV